VVANRAAVEVSIRWSEGEGSPPAIYLWTRTHQRRAGMRRSANRAIPTSTASAPWGFTDNCIDLLVRAEGASWSEWKVCSSS